MVIGSCRRSPISITWLENCTFYGFVVGLYLRFLICYRVSTLKNPFPCLVLRRLLQVYNWISKLFQSNSLVQFNKIKKLVRMLYFKWWQLNNIGHNLLFSNLIVELVSSKKHNGNFIVCLERLSTSKKNYKIIATLKIEEQRSACHIILYVNLNDGCLRKENIDLFI